MKTIGVFLGGDLQSGGGFQYERTIANILQSFGRNYKFVYFVDTKAKARDLTEVGLPAVSYKFGPLHKIWYKAYEGVRTYRFLARLGFKHSYFDKLLQRYDVDLVYFVAPNEVSIGLNHHHYIFTVWDLCHRDYLEFPEVGFSKRFESREEMYGRALKRAVAVIVDSALGQENVMRRYGIDRDRIRACPFLPSLNILSTTTPIDVKKKYDLTRDYIFYPAQFWAHKNHVYILDALKLLRDRHGLTVDAVFSGADKGNLKHVMKVATEYGLTDQVKHIGFVDAAEMPPLYRQALALVMPTYFGPTNIPPLEAFGFGCPVCYSDLPGLRDQVADGAFLMDLKDPASLVAHLLTLLAKDPLVEQKRKRGHELVKQWNEDDFWAAISSIFEDFFELQRRWKS